MIKLRITGLKKGQIREVPINERNFNRDNLAGELADLTLELIEKKLLSSSRDEDPKVQIFLAFSDVELLLCHFNGRLLCDLDTNLLDPESIAEFDFLAEEYIDAYDLIQDVVDHQFSADLDSLMNELNSKLDELNYEDGSRYKGGIKDGTPHGVGKMSWPDGSSYEGDWLDGMINGSGTYLWGDGAKYTGEWVNGQMHGKGKFTSATGDVSDGQFSLGSLVK